jgi:threonine aldolase
MKNYFGSDNFAGIHPEIIKSIEAANSDYSVAYGSDPYTKTAIEMFKNIFAKDVDVFFTLTGTGANIISLQSALNSFEAIITSDIAHIVTDECNALEKFSGSKCFTITSSDGKIFKDQIKHFLHNEGCEHNSQPKIISLTQSSEYGTVYSIDEIKEIVDFAHDNNLYVHIDGARIANACAFLDCNLKEMISDTNVDILSLGGTKNGLLFGEAVVFLNKKLSKYAKYYRKQAMQLFSKMRFISAQFIELFKNDLFYQNALYANQMAKYFADRISKIKGVFLTQKVQSNAIFLTCPNDILALMKKHFYFYVWNTKKTEIRLMTSFLTKKAEVEEFCSLLEEKFSG